MLALYSNDSLMPGSYSHDIEFAIELLSFILLYYLTTRMTEPIAIKTVIIIEKHYKKQIESDTLRTHPI